MRHSWTSYFSKRSRLKKWSWLSPKPKRSWAFLSCSGMSSTSSWLQTLRSIFMIFLWANRKLKWSRTYLLASLRDMLNYSMMLWLILRWFVTPKRGVCILISWIFRKVDIIKVKQFSWMLIFNNSKSNSRWKLEMGSKDLGLRALWILSQDNLVVVKLYHNQCQKPVLLKELLTTSKEPLKLLQTSKLPQGFLTRTLRCSCQHLKNSKMMN